MPTGPPDSPFSPQERSDLFSPQERSDLFSPQERSDVGGSAGEAGEGGSRGSAGEAGEGAATHDSLRSHDVEPVADRIIRDAMESGDFDDLPGTGKPIPGAGKVDDELWWVRSWLERNRHSGAQESVKRE